MAEILKQRMAAEVDGEFVVFLIGARFNKPWKLIKNFWFFTSMPAMLRELEKQPEKGLLGYRQHFGLRSVTIIQYWRSWEQLEAYARSKDAKHFPNWVKFNKKIGSNGDFGIWHETYRIAPGQYEAIYNNMPRLRARQGREAGARLRLSKHRGRPARRTGGPAGAGGSRNCRGLTPEIQTMKAPPWRGLFRVRPLCARPGRRRRTSRTRRSATRTEGRS